MVLAHGNASAPYGTRPSQQRSMTPKPGSPTSGLIQKEKHLKALSYFLQEMEFQEELLYKHQQSPLHVQPGRLTAFILRTITL